MAALYGQRVDANGMQEKEFRRPDGAPDAARARRCRCYRRPEAPPDAHRARAHAGDGRNPSGSVKAFEDIGDRGWALPKTKPRNSGRPVCILLVNNPHRPAPARLKAGQAAVERFQS
ncbi:MAG: hypothetical protein LT102_05565 [Burkholderiaceae bacterium]|nr:hypothetical protein [Burkholderiaceae bacterium]